MVLEKGNNLCSSPAIDWLWSLGQVPASLGLFLFLQNGRADHRLLSTFAA